MLPKRLERKTIYESPWINLYVDKVLMPSGKIIEKYHQLDYPKKGAVILAKNSKNEICFIQSLRYTTQKVEWELPAGNIEKNESALETSVREFGEETGLKLINAKEIYSYNPSVGMSNLKMHVVSGEVDDCQKNDSFDKDEVKEVFWFSENQIKKMIENNEITDGVSLVPILIFLSKGL